jgi:hypothetical protein
MLRRVIVLRLVCLLGLALGLACKISNDDHCVHKAIESDAWCAEFDPVRPFCSPCEAVDHGCVADQPDPAECPDYTPDSLATTGTSGDSTAD